MERATSVEPGVVFVVDDDVSVRESLAALVRCAGWQPHTFASAHAFLSTSRQPRPSCLVLDIELPDLNGLDLHDRLAADAADMPVIFVTGFGDIPRSVRAMKAGAAEFLTKPFTSDVMLSAIRSALERSRAALARSREVEELRRRYRLLTRRECEVMTWVTAGLLNKQVGAELGMTEATVKAHRAKVMYKMKAASLADLVRIASQLDLPLPRR